MRQWRVNGTCLGRKNLGGPEAPGFLLCGEEAYVEGACGKGGEAQVGWLKDTPAQHQVRANSSSKQEHVSGVLNTEGGVSEENQTCCLMA